jgi:hypothetical protein
MAVPEIVQTTEHIDILFDRQYADNRAYRYLCAQLIHVAKLGTLRFVLDNLLNSNIDNRFGRDTFVNMIEISAIRRQCATLYLRVSVHRGFMSDTKVT